VVKTEGQERTWFKKPTFEINLAERIRHQLLFPLQALQSDSQIENAALAWPQYSSLAFLALDMSPRALMWFANDKGRDR